MVDSFIMMKELKDLKVAFVTDSMIAPGGADRLLLSLLDLFDDSTIFTSVYQSENYVGRYIFNNKVKQSFLGRSWILRKLYRHLSFLTPIAFESFDLSGFDLVISLSAGTAKGVISQLDQPHIGIILTPPRSLWDMESNIRGLRLRSVYKVLTPFVANYLRIWDQTAIKRVDKVVSISKYIQKKVDRIYNTTSELLYPGLEDYWFDPPAKEVELPELPDKFYLVVSRLYDYKRVDWAIEAIQKNNSRLVVVGTGPDKDYLRSKAGPETSFVGWLEDDQIKALYQKAEGLLFCGEEDFGYVPVEAMASGCPVLAYNKGGVTETVIEKITGKFFENQNDLLELLRNHNKSKYRSDDLVNRAKEFSSEKMKHKFLKILNEQIQI